MSDARRRVAVVVEDDPDVQTLLETLLVRSGFEVVLAEDGVAGLAAVRDHGPVLTTVDVAMPGMDGFAVAREIREFSDTYIVVVTGLGEEIDVVQGFDSGADDYIVKPFRPRELRARIEAMLRRPREVARPERHGGAGRAEGERDGDERGQLSGNERTRTPSPVQSAQPPTRERPDPVLEVDGLVLNRSERSVSVQGGSVGLTRTEFDLLAALMSSGAQVRSKADLVSSLRDPQDPTDAPVRAADKRAVEVHVSNIRRKIGDSSVLPRWIETVHGLGYRMTVR